MKVEREAGKRLGAPRKPTGDEVQELLFSYGIRPSESEIRDIEANISSLLDELSRIDELREPPASSEGFSHRDPGYQPGEDEDPLNAYITKCLVKGASQGKMLGKSVALKDAICVAGIPCTNASRLLERFIPDDDATVVERLLLAGADITGKLNMACFSAEATSIDSEYGIVKNPHNSAHTAGGSSSGSGAAAASGEVDVALGADGGGSGRIPASWCGCVCIKPTRGLVPSHGVISFNPTLDAVTPMARYIEDVAVTLEVIAGPDDVSANQTCYCRPAHVEIPTDAYTKYLGRGIGDLRIGLVKESIKWDFCEQDVVDATKEAMMTFSDLGARCSEISWPMLPYTIPIHRTIIVVEAAALYDGPEGYFRLGPYNRTWAMMYDYIFKAYPNQLPFTTKSKLATGNYIRREFYSRYYAKAQNMRRVMEGELNQLLQKYDILVLPTVPFKAPGYDELALDSTNQLLKRVVSNLCAFNLLGHPALTIPCGRGEHNLPIGLQLVGRHFEESTLFQVAYEFEKHFSLYG